MQAQEHKLARSRVSETDGERNGSCLPSFPRKEENMRVGSGKTESIVRICSLLAEVHSAGTERLLHGGAREGADELGTGLNLTPDEPSPKPGSSCCHGSVGSGTRNDEFG